MNNIHVLQVASGDLWAGAEVQICTLCKELKLDNRIQISAIIFNNGELAKQLDSMGVKVYVLDESKLSSIQIFFEIFKILQTSKPDILHTHGRKQNILANLANLLACRCRSLRTIHGSQEFISDGLYGLYNKLLEMIEVACGKYLQQAIITVTESLKTEFSSMYPEEKICVINNGIDFDELYTNQGIFIEPPYNIAFIGRIEPVKRLDIYIEIANILIKKNNEKYIFHVYGDGTLKKAMERNVSALSLGNKVIFHGHVNNINIAIASTDLVIMCSDHEGLPMTALEVIGSETAMIVNPVGGLSELFPNKNSCFVVEANTAECFSEKIEMMINKAEETREMIRTKKKDFKSKYSAEYNAKKTVKLYELLISS